MWGKKDTRSSNPGIQFAQHITRRIPYMPLCFKFQDLFTFSGSFNPHNNTVGCAVLVLLSSSGLKKFKCRKMEWLAHCWYNTDQEWGLSLHPWTASFHLHCSAIHAPTVPGVHSHPRQGMAVRCIRALIGIHTYWYGKITMPSNQIPRIARFN